MKKRIISFLLAFATLFSCMSVSIFAVDSANVATEEQGEGGPRAGDVLENTLAPHTDELIQRTRNSYFQSTSPLQTLL